MRAATKAVGLVPEQISTRSYKKLQEEITSEKELRSYRYRPV